ncbi:MFS transporter [Vibrio olivae]|uniref:MFS transporter n=1 Tax=Vibrio olivae TaxID=1243002 RepID=A0ABV5HJX3_9VIBR
MISLGSSEYHKVTLSLALGSFLVFCNLYLFQPMLPTMAAHFSLSETQVNWVFAAATLALSVSLVPWAVSSESFGRRRVMLIGLFAMPMIGGLMLLTNQFWIIVVCRALMGIAIAAFASVAVAYMAEELEPKAFSQAIGNYIAANSLGGITGRIMGGNLTDAFGWHFAVMMMMGITLVGILVVFWLLPAQRHFTPQRGMLRSHNRSLITHMKNPVIVVAMLIGGANFALFVNLYSVMGFRLVAEPHNLPVGLASLIFLCYLGGTVSSKLSGRWSLRHSQLNGMLLGACISLSGMLIAYFECLPTMLLGLMLISFGAFFTHTLAYAWVSQKATHAKATATALYLVHYYIGGSLGGFFLIYCWQVQRWSGVIGGGLVLYALVFTFCLRLKSMESKQRTKAKLETV